MNPETINQIKELLTPVAQKIGETAEWGWGVVIKQMYVEAVLGTVGFVVGFILLFIAKKMYPAIKKSWGDGKDEDVIIAVGGGVLSVILLAIGSVLISSGGYTAITHFINPEFYALRFFIDLIK